MYVTVHGAIGASLAFIIFPFNPPAAFLLGWASHYLADAMPHGDEVDESEYRERSKYLKRMFTWGGVDLLLLGALSLTWLWLNGWSWLFVMAIAGAILPDVAWGLEALLGRKFMGMFGRLHTGIHNPLKLMLPIWFGLAAQGTLAFVLWWRLLI